MTALCAFSANLELHVEVPALPEHFRGNKVVVEDIQVASNGDGRCCIKIIMGEATLEFPDVRPTTLTGGSSVNIGCTLAKFGRPALVAAPLGTDMNRDLLVEELERAGIQHKTFCSSATALTVAATDPSGLTTLFCLKPQHTLDHDTVVKTLRGTSVKYVIATSVRTDWEVEFTRRLFEEYPNAIKAFIPHKELLVREWKQPSAGFRGILEKTYLFQVNEREANLFWRGPSQEAAWFGPEDIEHVVGQFGNRAPAVTIVTLGDRGAAAACFRNGVRETIYQPSHSASHVVDPTGCGDNFLAAFIAATDHGRSHQEAVSFASFTAARNAEGRGGHFAQVDRTNLETFALVTQQ